MPEGAALTPRRERFRPSPGRVAGQRVTIYPLGVRGLHLRVPAAGAIDAAQRQPASQGLRAEWPVFRVGLTHLTRG